MQSEGYLGRKPGQPKVRSNLGHMTCPLAQRQVRKVTKGLLTRPAHQSPSQAVLIHTLSILCEAWGGDLIPPVAIQERGRLEALSICTSWAPPTCLSPHLAPQAVQTPLSICLPSTPSVGCGSRRVGVSTEGVSVLGGTPDSNHLERSRGSGR